MLIAATITVAIAVIAVRAHRNALARGRVRRNLAVGNAIDRTAAHV